MVCLDSDILIDFLRKDKSAIRRITELKESGDNIFITSLNSFEIFRGLKDYKIEESFTEEFLSSFSILNFNFQSSKKAAEIFNDLKSKGGIIELPDIMIASICIFNNESLLTRNAKHFARIPELKLKSL